MIYLLGFLYIIIYSNIVQKYAIVRKIVYIMMSK